jgi:hypothetical protein
MPEPDLKSSYELLFGLIGSTGKTYLTSQNCNNLSFAQQFLNSVPETGLIGVEMISEVLIR